MSLNNELAEIALTSDRSVAQNSSNSNASSSTPFFLTPTGLLIRKLVAEFVGVMLMVILIGYVVNAVGNPSMRTARTDSTQSFSAALVCYSLVYGLAVATLMGMLAHISGGYFNPALVIGCYAIGSFDGSVVHAIFYILAQMAGSVVGASWLLLLPFPTSIPVTLPGAQITDGAAFGCEFLTTFFLAITWFSVSSNVRMRDALPIVIGKVVTCNVLTTAYLSGSSMNPARSFGPAVVSGNVRSHYIYWIGPIFGALFAALFHFLFLSTSLATADVSRPIYSVFARIHNSIVMFGRTKNGFPIRRIFVEFVATLILVVCAGFIVNSLGNPTLRQRSALIGASLRQSEVENLICFCLVGGLSKSILVAVFGPYSGGYFTPAVTLSAVLAGRFDGSVMLAIGYIVAQCIGSIVACAFLLLLPPQLGEIRAIIPTTQPGPSYSVGNALGAEVFVTFILAFGYLSISKQNKDNNTNMPTLMGGIVAVAALATAFVSGGSMNPARSFGPEVIVGFGLTTSSSHWIYWLGPFIGGVLAAVVEKYVLYPIERIAPTGHGEASQYVKNESIIKVDESDAAAADAMAS